MESEDASPRYVNQDPDLKPPKRAVQFVSVNMERFLAGAEAIGILSAFIDLGNIPDLHLSRVKEIVKRWEDNAL